MKANPSWRQSYSESDADSFNSAVQKIKKLSETPATLHNIATLCRFYGKNRKIAEKLVQPVTPHSAVFNGDYNGEIPENGVLVIS